MLPPIITEIPFEQQFTLVNLKMDLRSASREQLIEVAERLLTQNTLLRLNVTNLVKSHAANDLGL
jgi:hypothetical protein